MKLTAVLVLLTPFLMDSIPQDTPKKIIFFGDSITEMGVQPKGYITYIKELAKKSNRAGHFEFIGSGIGGNKVYDLYLRLEEDVLQKSPDMVVIYIGINDVWHKRLAGTGTDADKFERFYRAIIKTLKDNNIQVVLCTPAVIGERADNTNEQDDDLNHYSSIIRELARELDVKLVDLRTSFMTYYRVHNPQNTEKGILTTDRVHLNEKGNKLVADEMWKVIRSF
jgi:lysophospholipase L1-like esterase